MKIALISLYGIENIGIRSIKSVLSGAGFETRVYFLKKWRNNDIREPSLREYSLLLSLIECFSPDVIGIGFGSAYIGIASELTSKLRKVTSGVIVWGGIHATVCPEECAVHADAVCVGEGEFPMLDLVNRLVRKESYSSVENLWVRESSGVKRNPLRNLVCDLDSLPYPDYAPGGKYLIEDGKISEGDPLKYMRELRVCASRGCPFGCSYCYNSTLKKIYAGKGEYFRKNSVSYVIGSLEASLKVLNVKKIKFDDDTFASDRYWVEEFCREYGRRISLPFELMVHPAMLDESILPGLKKAGLVKIQTGIESVSGPQSEQVFKRPVHNERLIDFSRVFSRLGIKVVYDIIIDNPRERPDDKLRLIDFLLRLSGPFDLFLYSLTFFPKTGITEDFLSLGLISPADVEGRATKSFRQFRVSFDYPRPAADRFYISVISLCSKSWVPRPFIRSLSRSGYFKRNPAVIEALSQAVNLGKLCVIAWKMLLEGELTFMKFREYSSPSKLIVQ